MAAPATTPGLLGSVMNSRTSSRTTMPRALQSSRSRPATRGSSRRAVAPGRCRRRPAPVASMSVAACPSSPDDQLLGLSGIGPGFGLIPGRGGSSRARWRRCEVEQKAIRALPSRFATATPPEALTRSTSAHRGAHRRAARSARHRSVRTRLGRRLGADRARARDQLGASKPRRSRREAAAPVQRAKLKASAERAPVRPRLTSCVRGSGAASRCPCRACGPGRASAG